MIKTLLEKGEPSNRAIQGIDEKEFDGIQHLEGMYPEFVGQQTRIGGKTLHARKDYAIHGIYIFYNYYGRRIWIYEFKGGYDIVTPDPPPPPPLDFLVWYDDFESYELDWITPLYAGGEWQTGLIGHIQIHEGHLEDDMESYEAGDTTAMEMEYIDSGYYAEEMAWVGPWIETQFNGL